ncbi:MAG: Maltose acetyltransferase [Thelocarpon superellum]|nr:MAG: Maltose acetyltransferase [Thelocarpon superellum]
MTTSVSRYAPNGVSHGPDEHMADSPPSRFTAVNGRHSQERPNGASSSGGPPAAANGDPALDARPAPEERPRPIHLPELSPRRRAEEGLKLSSQRESWGQDPMAVDAERRDSHAPPHHPESASAFASNHNVQKRKRSESVDRNTSSTTSYQSQGAVVSPTRGPYPRHDGAMPEYRPRGRSSPDSVHGDTRGRRDMNYPSTREDGRGESRDVAYHGPRSPPVRMSYEPHHPVSPGGATHPDVRLAEALRRESLNVDTSPDSRPGGSPDEDDARSHLRSTDYGTDRAPSSGVQVDHRRRKRVFSNRTKTGCMTCRRRKKKCDEQKPECNNCIRGGFVCEGYSNRIEWQKSSREKAPVPLQAKDGEPVASSQYTPSSASAPLAQKATASSHASHGSHGRELSPLHYRVGHSSQAAPGAMARPIFVDDDHDRVNGESSPAGHGSEGRSGDWNKTSWSNPGHSSYAPERLHTNEYSRVPPLHELSRSAGAGAAAADADTDPHSSSHRSLLHLPAHNSTVQTAQQAHAQAQAQARAQLALQQSSSMEPADVRPSSAKTDKEKMLAGELYYPHAPELVFERDRCKASIWRFNNSMNPTLGISREERLRLFRDVVQPREPPINGAPGVRSPIGHVGENVVVEAPFICDYGYNISIGPEVLIDTNCTIKDTCSVSIGARTVIGPNVKLLTATMPIDPRRRKGSRGPSLGRAIVIEEDCWIGAGAIVLPGLTVGKSSTVGAGSVVTRNVPRFTVVAGNPARVHRGIYSNDNPQDAQVN